MKIYFVTVNEFKAAEVTDYLGGSGIELQTIDYRIQEILHLDLNVIVRDKVIKAYEQLGLPCAVEHGGLIIDALNGLPGGLSKVVWDTVGDGVCSFLKDSDYRTATAKSVVAYCDGRVIHLFEGETLGTVAEEARGDYTFQWDPIFIPEGSDQTYAEMGFPAKKAYSQAFKAWAKLIKYLES